jgi:hypothetical protein
MQKHKPHTTAQAPWIEAIPPQFAGAIFVGVQAMQLCEIALYNVQK